MKRTTRYRLADLRRQAAALAAAAGLAADRAAALAGHRLWYDAAGFPRLGVARLPSMLEALARGEIDPRAEARIVHEHPSTAVVDGRNGVPPLILTRAAEVAAEKAREVGVGVVRVGNLKPLDSAAEVAAELAIGPTIALLIGPRPSWTLALPTDEGLPLLLDTDLAALGASGSAGGTPSWVEALGPWSSVWAPEGGWLVLALAVTALDSLATFHERVASVLGSVSGEPPGVLRPSAWEAHRREAREHGVLLDPATIRELDARAETLGVTPLEKPER